MSPSRDILLGHHVQEDASNGLHALKLRMHMLLPHESPALHRAASQQAHRLRYAYPALRPAVNWPARSTYAMFCALDPPLFGRHAQHGLSPLPLPTQATYY